MVDKLHAALGARRDPDLAIVARCDAMRTDGYDEGVRRARLYADAGADVVMLFPNDDAEARRLPRDLPGIPLAYVNSAGNRLDRPLYPAQELQDLGYRMVLYPIATSIAAIGAVDRTLTQLATDGTLDIDPERLRAGRLLIEETIGLEAQYALEQATVEEALA
jgi:methylisocitrate lyase